MPTIWRTSFVCGIDGVGDVRGEQGLNAVYNCTLRVWAMEKNEGNQVRAVHDSHLRLCALVVLCRRLHRRCWCWSARTRDQCAAIIATHSERCIAECACINQGMDSVSHVGTQSVSGRCRGCASLGMRECCEEAGLHTQLEAVVRMWERQRSIQFCQHATSWTLVQAECAAMRMPQTLWLTLHTCCTDRAHRLQRATCGVTIAPRNMCCQHTLD
mmetsp:Transcript_18357/g.31665  ORF Transcript_18357/g.31665 Transcript_18357/m.31665 type:complete len:214 (-) Transcript_18357:167-808(-)